MLIVQYVKVSYISKQQQNFYLVTIHFQPNPIKQYKQFDYTEKYIESFSKKQFILR